MSLFQCFPKGQTKLTYPTALRLASTQSEFHDTPHCDGTSQYFRSLGRLISGRKLMKNKRPSTPAQLLNRNSSDAYETTNITRNFGKTKGKTIPYHRHSFRSRNANLNSSLSPIPGDTNNIPVQRLSDDTLIFKSVKLMGGDECPHCAEQGLEISARQAKIHREKMEDTGSSKLVGFQSALRSSCEFPFSFSYFLHGLAERPTDAISETPIWLAELPLSLPQGTRLRIRLNDHLNGEEGKRAWMIILEGVTVEALFGAIEAMDEAVSEYKVWENGIFGLK
ncbi:hypothetical protein CRM22_007165 [Opisthorchis felineus]|uniref:Uncharacterized protein n=1 Tax=Opisthorchis felineus TaxID=147828 RepID=A0A4V3SE26_OPIFE|nr:hypothetical protein CRM22_007165 [Opisthorchis felineus]